MLNRTSGRSAAFLRACAPVPGATRRDRVLIVAPHADDEIIGAGGYALDAIGRGAEVFVVFLTAGDGNRMAARLVNRKVAPGPADFLAMGRVRIDEAGAAMKMLGVAPDHFYILGYPDRGLRLMVEHRHAIVRSSETAAREVPYAEAMSAGAPYRYSHLINDMVRVLNIARPNIVIAPVEFDLHPDHSAAARVTDDVLEQQGYSGRRLGYLVHSGRIPTLVPRRSQGLVPPHRLRSFDWASYPLTRDVLEAKDEILRSYRSQAPYTHILRNAFVRTNELFLTEPMADETVVNAFADADLRFANA